MFLTEREHIDLVSADRKVPGIRGEDFVAIARRVSPLTPIIIISAQSPGNRQFHADGYLVKPSGFLKLDEEFPKLEEMARERSGWSEDQIAEFVAHSGKVRAQVDESVIRLSPWSMEQAREYLRHYQARGLHPIPSYERDGTIAKVCKDGFALVNLHESNGPPETVGPAGTYFSAHEAMEMHIKHGRVVGSPPEESLPTIRSEHNALVMLGAINSHQKYSHELIPDSAVTQYYGSAAITPEYCAWLEYNLEYCRSSGEPDLPYLAYRGTVAGLQGQAVPGLSRRLSDISQDFDILARDLMGGEIQNIQWYEALERRYSLIFRSTTVNMQAIREFERTIRR